MLNEQTAEFLPPELAVDPAAVPSDTELDGYFEAMAAGPDDGEHDAEAAREVDCWQAGNAQEAEWALRHFGRLQAQAAELAVLRTEWLDKIERWHEEQLGRVAPRVAYFERVLQAYAIAYREATGTATVHLPSGRIATRDTKPKVGIVDVDAAAVWCAENLNTEEYDKAVKVRREPRVSVLRDWLEITSTPPAMFLSCAHVLEAEPEAVGTRVLCPECGETREVVQVLAPEPSVVDSRTGERVDGAAFGIDPGGVSASPVVT